MELEILNSDTMFWDLTLQTTKFLVQILILGYLMKIYHKMKKDEPA